MQSRFTIAEIKKAIRHDCLELKIDSIRFLGEGDFCAAYLVNNSLVFRFAKHSEARLSLKHEFCLLPALAAHLTLSIPVPTIASLEADNSTPFSTYPLLPGAELTQEKYLALPEADRTACAHQTAHFLNELHTVDTTLAENCGVIIHDYTEQYSGLLEEAKAGIFSQLDLLEQQFIERLITDYLQSPQNSKYRPSFLHGDLSPNHFIYDEKTNRITSIIDFGDMMIGDPAWDFLWIYEDYGLDFLTRLLPEYHEPDKANLLRRIFQFSILEGIEWTINSFDNGDMTLEEATTQIRTLRLKEESHFRELLAIEKRI